MKVPQENSLCSYLTQAKMSFFPLLWRTGGKNRSCLVRGGVDTSGKGGEMGKVCRRVSMVQILCIHVYEMIPIETIPGMEGAGDKGGGIFKNAVFDVLLRTFIITTRYLHPA
jgi:hypothetical protein